MLKPLKSVIAASLLASCAGLACAQTTQPQFYMWGKPEVTWDNDHQFIPLIDVNVAGLTPAAAAVAIAGEIESYIATEGWAPDDKIAIFLRNFGNYYDDPPSLSNTSFIETIDVIGPPTVAYGPQSTTFACVAKI